jgi:hypothetical protein
MNWSGVAIALGLFVVGASLGPWGMLAFVAGAVWFWRQG